MYSESYKRLWAWVNLMIRYWFEVTKPIEPPKWDPHTVVLSTRHYQFLLFGGAGKKRRRKIVMFPPYAGRDGTIVTNLIRMYQRNGFDVYAFDLLPATWYNTAVSLMRLVGFAKECYRHVNSPKIVVGVCMGMWLSLLAMKGEEEKPIAQFVSAGPADTSKGKGKLTTQYLSNIPFMFFLLPVLLTGVNPGWLQWLRFTFAYDPQAVFVEKPKKLLKYVEAGDEVKIANWHRDQNWYYSPRNLGWWFLEAVQEIFINNNLKMMIDRYDWPIYIYAGLEDEITHWEQTVALQGMVENGIVYVFEKGGHTLTFNGPEQLMKMEADILSLTDELDYDEAA